MTKSYLELKAEDMEKNFQILKKNEEIVPKEELKTRYKKAYRELRERVCRSTLLYIFGYAIENICYELNQKQMAAGFNLFANTHSEEIKSAALAMDRKAIDAIANDARAVCMGIWYKCEKEKEVAN